MNQDLFKFAGMSLHQGKYTPEQWEEKIGINPRAFKPFIHITQSNLCVWTDSAEKAYCNYIEQKQRNFAMLTEQGSEL